MSQFERALGEQLSSATQNPRAALEKPAPRLIVVIGVCGCGKSTLLKVLLGLRIPQEGEVLYGGIPVRQLGLSNVRRCIGTVLQDDVLLAGSIADNIRLGKPDATEAELMCALKTLP